jgi:cholesterol transport system auxiliary component
LAGLLATPDCPRTSVRARARRHAYYALALGFALALAACASATSQTFDLSAVAPPRARALSAPLTVRTTAPVELDSRRIVVRTGSDSLAYLSGAQWSDRLPALVQKRLVQSLMDAKMLPSATQGPDRAAGGYDLELDIRAFELDVSRRQALVEISTRLVTAAGRVIAERVFKGSAPSANDGAQAAAAALDASFSLVMRQIVGLIAGKI